MLFKKGIIANEVSQDFQVAAELAGKYKLDGVEISLSGKKDRMN